MTVDLTNVLLQLPIVGLMLGVVIWFIRRADGRDERWWQHQESRDAKYLKAMDENTRAVTEMREAVGHLDRTLRKNGGDPTGGR